MNEEEIKNKIVMPFLSRLAVDVSELAFEHSFSFHFGTHQLKVNGAPRNSGTIQARLDILVTRGGLPLFVVEVKRGDHRLNDADRDQAVSYAKLLHPVAPYAITTNGTEYRLYEAITKREIQTGDFVLKNGYEVVVPDSARNEAIDFFLGFSPQNLLQFCQSQVEEHLRPLVGSPDDLTKKYVPELTVPRTDLADALSKFERSDTNAFLLLADSGRGKTTALCDYARHRLSESKLTLFFSGNRLEGSLLTAIVSEFNWTFAEQLTAVALVKRLNLLARGIPMVIVVDALDEWEYPQKAQSLIALLSGARHLKIKLVVSCKTGSWDDMSKPRGSDLGFAQHLFKATPSDIDGFNLGPMSGQEFYNAIDRYRSVFGVHGAFEDKVLVEARQNPFLLRVMFAVASKTGQQRLTFSSLEFFERYCAHLLRLTGKQDVAEVQLLGAARSMDQRNRAAVPEHELRADLALPPNGSLLPALFEQNILQRTREGVRFYFQQFRDFLIAFRIRRWPDTRGDELATVAPIGVIGEALTFYLRHATDSQLRAVAGPIIPNAEAYLT